MNTINLIFIFIFGLVIGSFINVCIYRIPNGKSIIFPGSSCPACGEKIRTIDLIPVLSYILLRAKCRICREPISVRYPLVELLTAILFTALYIQFGLSYNLLIYLLIYAAIISILIMIFFIDLEHMIIPDGLNLAIGLLGIALNIVYPDVGYVHTAINMILGILLGGGLFFILACFGAMGGGDIKLMAALGAVFGWKMLIPLMFLSFVMGGLIGIILLVFKIKKMKDMIPFGPYIAIAGIITIFYGSNIIEWYLKLAYL